MPKTHIPTPKTKGDRGGLFPRTGGKGAVATLAAGGSPYFNESA